MRYKAFIPALDGIVTDYSVMVAEDVLVRRPPPTLSEDAWSQEAKGTCATAPMNVKGNPSLYMQQSELAAVPFVSERAKDFVTKLAGSDWMRLSFGQPLEEVVTPTTGERLTLSADQSEALKAIAEDVCSGSVEELIDMAIPALAADRGWVIGRGGGPPRGGRGAG